MAEHCKACGADITAGQRFCRKCGVAVAQPSPEEVPTKVLQPGAQAAASTLTTPLYSHATEPVAQHPTAYQSPPAQSETLPQPSLSHVKPRRMRFLPLILIASVFVALIGTFLLLRIARRHAQLASDKSSSKSSSPVKVVNNRPGQPGAALMSEEGANVTDEKTIISRTYPLGENATVSLVNITGNIKIEGWDQPQAEVRVTKEGGSEQDRQGVQIKLANRSDLLSLETAPTRSSPVEVHYELKLPRSLRQLEIKSADSKVELSKMTGAINVTLQGSSIELDEVAGTINTKIVQGETRASFDGKLDGPQVLKSINGDIEVRLATSLGAEISAETVDGEIEADDSLQLKVEKRPVGQRVAGRVGSGGMPINIKTVNGDIRIKQ
jgi:hypothetical protein